MRREAEGRRYCNRIYIHIRIILILVYIPIGKMDSNYYFK
jgi:hypothetical protein